MTGTRLRPSAPTGPGPVRRLRLPRTRHGLPVVLLLPALIGFAFLIVPLLALFVRAPWSQLGSILQRDVVLNALQLSLVTASIATIMCLIAGVPLAWLLARSTLPGRQLARTLVTVPLTLPPVVGGVALLLALGRSGLVGQYLTVFGVSLPFTTAAVVVAQAFVAMPFLVITVDGALRGADRRYEDAAATLGASRWLTFRRVTLPMVGPGVAAGAVLCWARALGEFGATITFAGNFPGETQTMPLAIYLQFQTEPEVGIVLSLILLTVSVVVLAGLRDRWVHPSS